MKISKAAMTRLKKSDFWIEALEVTKAWDYYLYAYKNRLPASNDEAMKEMSIKLGVIRKALSHILGKSYGFTQTDTGYILVNLNDPTDILLEGERYISPS